VKSNKITRTSRYHSKKTISLIALLLVGLVAISQTETYYHTIGTNVVKTDFREKQLTIRFQKQNKNVEPSFDLGITQLAVNLIPLLVDEASKLFYNQDNYNKEYMSHFSFFDGSVRFNELDTTEILVFDKVGTNSGEKKEILSRFEFSLGAVENREGYYY
jgi:hypothetical protein